MPFEPPFTVSYTMLTGAIRREAGSAILALMDQDALRQAGATKIEIRDVNGLLVTVEDLKRVTGR